MCCTLLTVPALVVTAVGLGCGHNSSWLKLLPACVFGVSMVLIDGVLGGYKVAPPKVAVASVIASCVGTLLLPGRKGVVFGGIFLCIAMYYDCRLR